MTSYFKPIYSTNQLLKDRNNYQIISNDNFKKSFDNDPYIINNIYNQMDNRKYNLNKNYSPFIEKYNKKQNIEFFDNQDNISNYKNNFSDIHDKQNNLSMIDYQFEQLKYNNPGNPTARNNKPKNINNKSYLEDNIINDYSPINNTHMIYDINRESIDKPDESIEDKNKLAERMVHNNMVPFFSEKQAGESIDNYERYGNITTRKMDQFTGSLNDEMYRPKTERRPLFNPMVGLTNVYGSPVKTSEFEGRYVPSKERRNEKPFQEVRVTPGLNLPYHAVSNVGFHDPYRILPKNIDELRTLDNPQISYSPPVKWGQVSTERAARPNVNVYKPPTFVENERLPEYIKGRVKQCLDPGARERLPTKAYYDKEKIRDNFDVRNLATDNRGVNSTDWVGPINYNVTKESVIGKVNINRQNFEHPGPSNIGIDDTNRSYILNRIGLVPSLTNRNIHNQEESGNIGTSTSDKLYTYDKSGIKPGITNRNIYNQEESGNIGTSTSDKLYTYDKSGIKPRITNRNIYNQEESGNIGTSTSNKSYTYDKSGIKPGITNRNIYNQEESGNIGTSNSDKLYTYDKSGIKPGVTNRNIYNQEESGNIGTSNSNKSYTYDKSGIKPGITNRNIYNQEESGNIGTSTSDKLYTYDKSGIKPGITNRNIYNQEESGNIGTNTSDKLYTYDKSGIKPGITNRNIYNQEELGNIGTSTSNKSYTYDKSGIKPRITNRNIYNQEESGNIGTSTSDKLYTYDKSGIKPGITNRNIYNQEESGNIGTSTSNKSYTYDKSGIKPGITNRNIYNYTDHNGAAPVSIVKQMSRESANNMYVNQGKDNLTIIHHSPTPVKYYKTPSNDNKVLRMCNKIQVNRDLYPDIKQQLVIGTEPLQNDVSINQWYTRPKQSIDSTEWRFLLPIKENLQGNPYINNLLYKSENVLKNDIRPLPNIQQQIQNLAAIYNIDNYK